MAYHRVLSHRSLVLNKTLERVLVTLGLPAGTPIQWAGNHRQHHAHADRRGDPHSPAPGLLARPQRLVHPAPAPAALPAVRAGRPAAHPVRRVWHRPRTNQQFDHLAPDVAADPYYRLVSRPGPYLAFAVAHVAVFFGGGLAAGAASRA